MKPNVEDIAVVSALQGRGKRIYYGM